VTKELVESMLEDLCKVAIDRNREGGTGDFERIFRQPTVEVPRYVGNILSVEGKAFKKPKPPPKQYLREIKVPKKKPSPEDGDKAVDSDGKSVSPSGSEEIIYKLYNWDVERINRLAQPRVRHRETPPEKSADTQPIQSLRNLREISPRKKTSQSSIKARSPTKTTALSANSVNLSGGEYYLTQKQARKRFEAKIVESTDYREQISQKSRDCKHKGLEKLYSAPTLEHKQSAKHVYKTEVNTTDVTVNNQHEETKAKFKWEAFVPKSPKPIIPPKSTARVTESATAKWDMLLRTETRERSLELRPSYITGLPPARLRLQRERTAAPAKSKKVPFTPSVYRVTGDHFRNRSVTTIPQESYHSFVMPPGAILSGKLLQKQSRVGVPSAITTARFKSSDVKRMQIPL